MSVAFLCLPVRRACHSSRVSSVHASQHTHTGGTADVWSSLARVRRHSHRNAITTAASGTALKRATPQLHINAIARASRAKSSWGKFGRKPADLSHLSPRLRAAIEKKNEEKLAFQHLKTPVEVYPEPQQTVTSVTTVMTDEELNELAHLQPSLAQMEQWRVLAVEEGQYEKAIDLSRLIWMARRDGWPYFLLDPHTPAYDLDWQLVDMLAKGRESAMLAVDDNLRPYNDPMDGAAMNAWLLERIILRLENYRTAEEKLTRVMNVTFPAIVSIARRASRSRGLLDRLHYWKKSVLGFIMEVEHMLYVVKRIIHNNYR